MRARIFASLFLCFLCFLCSLFFVVGGDAQSPNIPEKPVWTLEFIKVQPENLAPAMQYLEDHWTRARAQAKRQGTVLDYHIISNVTPGHKVWDKDSIVLLTKYKSMDAYLEKWAAYQNGPLIYLSPDIDTQHSVAHGVVMRSAEDALEALNTQVFEETDTSTELKLPAKR